MVVPMTLGQDGSTPGSGRRVSAPAARRSTWAPCPGTTAPVIGPSPESRRAVSEPVSGGGEPVSGGGEPVSGGGEPVSGGGEPDGACGELASGGGGRGSG